MNAYDETQYVVEHGPLPNNLVWFDIPHWCQNPTDLQIVNSMIHLAPFWLRDILAPLSKLYRPLHGAFLIRYTATMTNFVGGRASLACLTNLFDIVYEVFTADFPPHVLEWDVAGSIHVSEDHELFLGGGEIKSLEQRKNTFHAHPLLEL